MKQYFLLVLCLFFISSCAIQGINSGFQNRVLARPLSLNDPSFRTCVFDPGYSIVHFPMSHAPPSQNETVDPSLYEHITKSQFQLLHTILAYNRSHRPLVVFEESVTQDIFGPRYMSLLESGQLEDDTYERLSGVISSNTERLQTANLLFRNGFPTYYEYLNPHQKQYLYEMGASFTLYFLKELKQLYKVISKTEFDHVKANLNNDFSSANIQRNPYWVFDFRDMALAKQIQAFYGKNPSYHGIVLIAYGADHDFSDDFARLPLPPFQAGYFCLGWETSYSRRPPLP